ncbi:MAG: polysaccharide deacetylase family protein [Clostridia bacterium]|nr:polysaccharide deacetylase family protein [Clostridia bacterium]
MKKIIGIILPLILIFHCSVSVLGTSQEYGAIYCRNSSHLKQVALTFDDGPHPRYTKEILSILDEFNVTATFFIIGVNAERYPEDLKRIVNAGCEIGNHTYSHTRLSQLSSKQVRWEIERCQTVVQNLVGIRPVFFRPPQGAASESVKTVSREMEYDIILWSIDTRDWELTPSAQIAATVLSQLKGGDIILMHDYVSGGNTTCDALRIIIPEILSRGYEFVTVSDLID